MPAVRTAIQLVQLARVHAQEMSKGTYRDGFSIDTGPDGVSAPTATAIPILSFVNQALGIMAAQGFVQQNFGITLVVGTREYTIPAACGKIVRARCIMGSWSCDLTNISYDAIRRRVGPDWERVANGSPNLYFTLGQFITIHPAPSAVGSLTIRAHDIPPDLAASTDTPTTLPTRWHDALALLAALLLVNSDADNPAQGARQDALLALWDLQDKELRDVIDARSVLNRRAREGG